MDDGYVQERRSSSIRGNTNCPASREYRLQRLFTFRHLANSKFAAVALGWLPPFITKWSICNECLPERTRHVVIGDWICQTSKGLALKGRSPCPKLRTVFGSAHYYLGITAVKSYLIL